MGAKVGNAGMKEAPERIGRVDSVWRYPVKSMRGESLTEAVFLFSGVYGDRVRAFTNTKAIRAFPFHTARDQENLVLYSPRFRHPERAARPANWADAQALEFGPTTLFASAADLQIDVTTPDGRTLAVEDPALIGEFTSRFGGPEDMTLMCSDRSLTDARPVSIFSLQTAAQLADETRTPIDKRRFRANLYADFLADGGFAEERYIGRKVRIGARVVVAILQRDPRCKVITIDPDTGARDKTLLQHLNAEHEGHAGLYAAVLVEGVVRPGDDIHLLS